MEGKFSKTGFIHAKALISPDSLQSIKSILQEFHRAWLKDNKSFYLKQGLNSSSITGSKYLSDTSRLSLFRFISQEAISKLISNAIPDSPCFMNTQLFFNPYNKSQKNYWHRDPQYHLTLVEQEEALRGPEVLHIRVALEDERGIELILGSHKRWDSSEELDTRLEQNGRRVFYKLSNGVQITMAAGDVLLFSAKMIHRGIYDHEVERFAFDILVCDSDPGLLEPISMDVFPDESLIKELDAPWLFENSLRLK